MSNKKKALVPKFDRVIIKRDAVQKENSLIQLPDAVEAKHAPAKGIVIAVGPTAGTWQDGKLIEKIDVGSYVVFGNYAGKQVELDGEKLWIVQDTDILAVIE